MQLRRGLCEGLLAVLNIGQRHKDCTSDRLVLALQGATTAPQQLLSAAPSLEPVPPSVPLPAPRGGQQSPPASADCAPHDTAAQQADSLSADGDNGDSSGSHDDHHTDNYSADAYHQVCNC